MSPELNELRNVIISSHLSTCYLLIEHLGSRKVNRTVTKSSGKTG